ncbi:menaquinone-dependent protoporphyrinogen IX dehydrogenase [Salinimicrobium terrae]|uniref:menaquinone-dependent protoporphyrinogen IX dehydrogenase n=1 Tax=Salinimicrobium terrae TaxID=470866 RepID=UPI0004077B2A|nr:menaquinone-dependent protoporphyrinogen IX dehydrogenase [Salinimicrobium terrae]
MKPIAILYSTVDGQTKKISEYLATHLEQKDLKIHLNSLDKFDQKISQFDTVVIGASIRYGKHNPLVEKFINENQKELEQINGVFFSVNLVARKADKNEPETNPYLKKFLNSIQWKPDLTGVFAGSLDYKKYGFFDKLMIKAIMIITNGPTKNEHPIEYTDWQRVKMFGESINGLKSKPEISFIREPVSY